MAELPQKHRVSVSGVLKILGVSRSGYRAWKQRVPSVSEKHRDHIKDAIKQIYDGSHQNYGAPKITEMLHRQGESIAEKTVGNYMRQMGIKAQWVKPYTVTTIDSDFNSELQNILDEQFNPSRPDAVWVSDITYIWTYNGFVYLTSIMDLYSRKIIAWVLSQSLEAIHVVECVNKAKQMRNVTSPLVFHSDRGIQFVSQAFQKVTEGMINSYSKKAYPWDNACIESFHSLLKREWLNRFKIFDYKHAYRLVFEYIETFYNTVRIHSHCGYLSPDEYEKQYRRMGYFGLSLEEEKSRLIEFGRYAKARCQKLGKKPETFTFLGFTHYCSQSRNGRFRGKRKTSKKKFAKKCREINLLLARMRKCSLKEIVTKLNQILTGYYHYYGITDNSKSITAFRYNIMKSLFYCLNRRSQKKSYNWIRFLNMMNNSYPLVRLWIYVSVYE